MRLVKTIGDAAMLVSPDVGALVDAGLDLHDAAAAQGEDSRACGSGSRAGRRSLRGGDGPVALYRARRAEAGESP